MPITRQMPEACGGEPEQGMEGAGQARASGSLVPRLTRVKPGISIRNVTSC